MTWCSQKQECSDLNSSLFALHSSLSQQFRLSCKHYLFLFGLRVIVTQQMQQAMRQQHIDLGIQVGAAFRRLPRPCILSILSLSKGGLDRDHNVSE